MSTKHTQCFAVRSFSMTQPPTATDGTLSRTHNGIAMVRPVRETAAKLPSGKYVRWEASFSDPGSTVQLGIYRAMADGSFVLIRAV